MRGEFFGEEELFEISDFNHFNSIQRKYCVVVTSSKASIYSCPIEVIFFFFCISKIFFKNSKFFVKFIQERPKFKGKIQKMFQSRKNLRNKCMKFTSFGESLLKVANVNKYEEEEEIKFRKSVEDLNLKLAFNRKIKNDEKTGNSKSHSKNKSIVPPLSLHDKVVNLIKFNKSKTKENFHSKENYLNQEKGIFCNQEKGNKKLIKQLMDIQTKYSKKNEESRFNSTYFTTNTLRKVNYKEKKTEKDQIDQILLDSQNNFSQFDGETISLTSRKLNNFSIDPNLWTSRSENF